MRELLPRNEDFWALIRRQDQPNDKLALFIHGFRGAHLTTWGKLPDMLEKGADNDQDFANWDFLFLGYNTWRVQTYLDIANVIITEWRNAQSGARPYDRKYTKLALFGHSLGTLGIRQLLCAWSGQPANMLGSIHSITLFGTPLNGSPWGTLASWSGYEIAAALKPENPQLRMLKVWTESAHAIQPWPRVRLVLGQDDQVVGNKFSELIQWHGDHPPDHTAFDHGDLVKPPVWQSKVIDIIGRGLR